MQLTTKNTRQYWNQQMKTLKQIQKTKRRSLLRESDSPITVDCRLLQVRNELSDDEKLDLMEQFANELLSINDTDVFLFAIW